ncbi:MAG: acetyltransferase-like isoleucine patch superfamily enzyme [Zhongshania aliphaticivorans]|jgi:acetyltransferase-like isoleucine patch superfamily enzyme
MFQKIKTQALFCYVDFFCFLANIYIPFWPRRLFLRFLNVRLSQRVAFHPKVRFFGVGRVDVGEGSVLNSGLYLDNRASIKIGANVSLAHDTKIYTAGHIIDSCDFEFYKKSVVIEDYVVTFSGVMIMPGVVLGRGAVVLPGSVVTKNVEPNTVVGGNPAKFVKVRNASLTYKLDYRYFGAN